MGFRGGFMNETKTYKLVNVTVTDVDIPFSRLFVLLLKISIALIPVAFVITFILGFIGAILAG